MAITRLAAPATFNPAYNINAYYYDSTNKNQTGFSYVVDIYEAGTSTKIYEGRIAPRPNDGYGYFNLTKTLTSQLSLDLPIGNATFRQATTNFVRYDVKIGEEYVISYTIDTPVDDSGYLKLDTTAVNTFAVGDQVVITGADVASVNGLHTIIDVTDTDTFTIDLVYDAGMASLTTGSITYADNRKTITRDLNTLSGQVAYDAAIAPVPYTEWDANDWNMDSTSDPRGKFLTSAPDNFYVAESVEAHFMMYSSNTSTYCARVYYKNSNGDVAYRSTANAGWYVMSVPVGTANLNPTTATVGTLPIIKDDTEWYQVWMTNGSGTRTSDIFTFYIDRRCTANDYNILFKDRMGSWLPFSFGLLSTENKQINRSAYKKSYGDYDGVSAFTYDTTARGNAIFNVDETTSLTLNTNWMNDEASVYFKELMTSPECYLLVDGNYLAVTVNETSHEVKRERNKKMIRYTVSVTMSINDPING
jgi:hypothetical protein